MALITRLSRLLRADLHALLDRLEEPDILLAQALREMEDAVAADDRALAALRRQHTRTRERRDALARQGAGDVEQLEVCLDAGQDDLARALLRRGLERERLDARLERTARELDGRIEGLAATLTERRRRLEQLRAEAALLARSGPTGAGPGEPLPGGQGASATWLDPAAEEMAPVRDADVEVALLAAKRRRSA